MTRYVALLRAVNVSGHNMIKMTDLKRSFEGMGFAEVQTYIQSGNVLFTSQEEAEPLRQRIEAQILADFGLTVPAVLRTAGELERIVQDCPFPADSLTEGESLHVALLADTPTPEAAGRLLAAAPEGDEFRLIGREVYLLYQQPSHKSKLTNQLLEQKLGVASTARNWRTVSTLAAMARAIPA